MAASSCSSSVYELDNLILKCNLWKFLKVLRAEYIHIYKMVVGASKSIIQIEIWSKENNEVITTLSPAQFVEQLKTLPTKGVAYRIHFRIYTFEQQSNERNFPIGESVWVAIQRKDLSFNFFPHLLAYICYEAIKNNNSELILNLELIRHYNLSRKDVKIISPLIATYNELLKAERNNNNNK